MTPLDPARLHRTTREIAAELASDPAMAAEIARARREFIGGGGGSAHLDPAVDARFCEWFVIERDSDVLGDVPARVVGGVPPDVREALLDSVCGLFLVESAGDEFRLRDVITDDDLTMVPDPRVAPGDVLMGRLYPTQDGLVALSPCVTRVRDGAALATAVKADLGNLDLSRRLSQAEVEAVLHLSRPATGNAPEGGTPEDGAPEDGTPEDGTTADEEAPDAVSPEQLEAQLDELLREADDIDWSAAEISRALAASPEGPAAVIGPLLEQFAFETELDLGALQHTLLELWNAHRRHERAARRAPRPASPAQRRRVDADDLAGPGLGAAIARRLDEGLAAKEDIDKLFGDVEGLLGVDDEEEADEDGWSRPEGDLDPLVTEFLWERSHAPGSAAATVLTAFIEQQGGLPVPGVYLEAIPPNELARFLLQTYLAAPPGQRAARVSAYFAVLSEFFVWAEDTQEYALAVTIETCRSEVAEPLARTARASLALSTATEVVGGLRPQVHRVLRIEAGEVEVVSDNAAPVWLDLPTAASLLRVGDIVLAGLETDGRGGTKVDGLAVVLPAGAAELIE